MWNMPQAVRGIENAQVMAMKARIGWDRVRRITAVVVIMWLLSVIGLAFEFMDSLPHSARGLAVFIAVAPLYGLGEALAEWAVERIGQIASRYSAIRIVLGVLLGGAILVLVLYATRP
jgi:hypothetical protein